MTTIRNLGASLLAALSILLVLAREAFERVKDWTPPGLMPGTAGAVSVLYSIRGVGVTINASATPPTAPQAAQCQKQSAKVVFGVTADAQALFTHNWGLDISAVTYFEPEIFVNPISTTTYWPLLTFDWTSASNVMIINKPATDAPTTFIVTIRRPYSTAG